MRRLLGLLLTCLLLVGCFLKPLTTPSTVAPPQGFDLKGQIGTMRGYHVQLTDLLNDFARGATVSLIEVAGGQTVGTSLADANGAFVIRFGSSFAPARTATSRSVAYYLEAIKGVSGTNPMPNQAGADAMRLRTLIWYDFANSGWVSLANAAPGPITISISTTTVAFYINQKVVDGQPDTAEAFIGSIDPALAGQAPNDYQPAGGLAASVYGNLFAQVTNAVVKDQDPIHAIVLTPTGAAVNTQTDLAVSAVTPAAGGVGTVVTLTGIGFDPPRTEVAFVGATATVDQAASSATSLRVSVPPGARSGLIRLTLNGLSTYSSPFTVTTHDGHRAVFVDGGGNVSLFATSPALGSLVRVNPDGSTRTLSTALSNPRGVLVNPEGAQAPPYRIYVANAGTGRIVQLDDQGTVQNANFLTVSDPVALALGPDGDLYVSQGGPNQILRVRVDWNAGTVTNAAVATYTGFSGPGALAFDYNRNLYVVENSQGRVQRFLPQAADSGVVAASPTPWAYLSDPQGIAIDTAGNSFVTSPTNNVIYRIDPFRNASTFVGVDGARSITRDPQGSLYVVDQTRSLIRRITLSGDQRIYAYGLASLRGLAVDPSGNVYVSLKDSGAVLRLSSDGVTTGPLISGIAAPDGLTLRNGNLYVAHTETHNVTEVALSGSARSAISSGLKSPGGVELSADGSTYYVGRLNLNDNWSGLVPTGGDPWSNSGIDVVTGGTITHRRALIHGTYDWNGFGQALWRLDATTFVVSDRDKRKLIRMSSLPAGDTSQSIVDVTPTFNGVKQFPNAVYDVVYDGTRYLYVSCADKNIYRIDTQNYSAAPGVITGVTGYPYGMTMTGGVLYVVDRGAKRIRRVSSPSVASAVDAFDFDPTMASSLLGATNYGGFLYLSDYNQRRIWRFNPADLSMVSYAELNGGPSRLHAFNDGRLLVRVSDGVYYTVSTAATPVVSQYLSTIGCTSCRHLEFFIDSANGVHWLQPRALHRFVNATGILNTRELARDADWLYIAATHGLYGMNLSTGEELSVNNLGTPMGLAVDSSTRTVFALNSGGRLYTVDFANRQAVSRLVLPAGGWGLDYDATANRLYAACSGNGLVYSIDASTWTQAPLRMGLHAPVF